MCDEPLALRAAGDAPPQVQTSPHRQLHATKQVPLIAVAASIAALAVVGLATAQAKQQCSVRAGHHGYWSWRMIDGRKCWYEGKPMISRSSLQWPELQPAPKRELATAPTEKRGNPLDAQAYMPNDFRHVRSTVARQDREHQALIGGAARTSRRFDSNHVPQPPGFSGYFAGDSAGITV